MLLCTILYRRTMNFLHMMMMMMMMMTMIRFNSASKSLSAAPPELLGQFTGTTPSVLLADYDTLWSEGCLGRHCRRQQVRPTSHAVVLRGVKSTVTVWRRRSTVWACPHSRDVPPARWCASAQADSSRCLPAAARRPLLAAANCFAPAPARTSAAGRSFPVRRHSETSRRCPPRRREVATAERVIADRGSPSDHCEKTSMMWTPSCRATPPSVLPPSRGTSPRCFSWKPAAAARPRGRRLYWIREPSHDEQAHDLHHWRPTSRDNSAPPTRLPVFRQHGRCRLFSAHRVCPTLTASCAATSAAARRTRSVKDSRICCACPSTELSESDEQQHVNVQLTRFSSAFIT